MNIGGAFLLMGWLIAPVLYCKKSFQCSLFCIWAKNTVSNTWNVAYFPIFSYTLFDNRGSPYNPQKIITNSIFDPVKYAAYSPVYIPMIRALSFGSCFATITATLVHIFCKL